MAPYPKTEFGSEKPGEVELRESEGQLPKLVGPQAGPRKYKIIYQILIPLIYAHAASVYSVYLLFTSVKWPTIILNSIVFALSMIGVIAGAHRLWSHRSYKAKLPLQILLMLMNSMAYQFTIFNWVRDHRLHHRYSDTDADPHNSTRGFFYSHIGWTVVVKHPEVAKRGKFTDLSDIYANPVVMFQKNHPYLTIGTCFAIIPMFIPMYFWGESLSNAWHMVLLRFLLSLHATFCINSFSHIFGTRPYDKNIVPVQNKFVSLVAFGEGFHNYHHTYPWDYRAAEVGDIWLNPARLFIDFFAWVGWAYDLKTVPEEVVKARARRTGDGSYGDWGYKFSDDQ